MVTDKEIADAEAVANAAYAAHCDAQRHLNQLKVTHACEQHKVGIGMIVVDDRGRKGVVTKVRPAHGKPWVYAKQIKKDGSQGERELSMYTDWKVVE